MDKIYSAISDETECRPQNRVAFSLEPVSRNRINLIKTEPVPFTPAQWLEVTDCGAKMEQRFSSGQLAGRTIMGIDLLIGADYFVTFVLNLFAGERQVASCSFSALNWCQTRIVREFPPAVMDGVDRCELIISRKPAGTVRICLGQVNFSTERPTRLTNPALPRGTLLDRMGQYRLSDWANKTKTIPELLERLRQDQPGAWPDGWSRWGGDTRCKLGDRGFFRTQHDGRRWWLVDPDGFRFWSAGADCVHSSIDHEVRYQTRDMDLRRAMEWLPEGDDPLCAGLGRNPWHHTDDREANFIQLNFMRAFGVENWKQQWEKQTFNDMRRIGFNTAGDWSDEEACSRAGIPYCRALELGLRFKQTPLLLRNLPDVFHPGLAQDAARYAEQLRPTRNDPAMVGYFMHNEPSWHFGDGSRSPAEEMLRLNVTGASRERLSEFLRARYQTDERLATAWGMEIDFARLRQASVADCTPAARRDLEAFSTVMLRHLIDTLSLACRNVDPNHLNLGIRWWTFPPFWALRAMTGVDVISFNYYQPKLCWASYPHTTPEPGAEELLRELNKPVLVGEWHFGHLQAGLPSAGLYGVTNEVERGKAYRVYLENAAANPWCVGVHWFNFYDRTVLYNPEANENYHIGFLDITHRRHQETCIAGRCAHERLYAIADGELPPYNEPVEYLFPSR